MSKINFVRASLTKTQYATNFLNKTKKKNINNPTEGENYVLTTQDTPISCITAEEDFNYFLAKGCRNLIKVPNCQAGFPFSEKSTVYSNFQFNGQISYTVKPGKITRAGMVLYTGKEESPPVYTGCVYYVFEFFLLEGESYFHILYTIPEALDYPVFLEDEIITTSGNFFYYTTIPAGQTQNSGIPILEATYLIVSLNRNYLFCEGD